MRSMAETQTVQRLIKVRLRVVLEQQAEEHLFYHTINRELLNVLKDNNKDVQDINYNRTMKDDQGEARQGEK